MLDYPFCLNDGSFVTWCRDATRAVTAQSNAEMQPSGRRQGIETSLINSYSVAVLVAVVCVYLCVAMQECVPLTVVMTPLQFGSVD